MANPWFRLYSEFATDPKVQMLSETDQRRYIMLLCLRCSNGDVTLHETELAFQLRISETEWAQTKAVLVAKKLITEDGKPTAWDKRQYVSDSSAARVARHRKNKKLLAQQGCNVTVTPPDTDSDTDKSSSAKSVTSGSGSKTSKPKPVGVIATKLVAPSKTSSPLDPVCEQADRANRLAEINQEQIREALGVPDDPEACRAQLLSKFKTSGVHGNA
jgi:hypothetical protein